MARASDFSAAVRQHSWDWLAALQRRLGVDRLQLVDEHGSPLVPEAITAYWATTLRTSEVASVIAHAVESTTPASVRIGQLQVGCIALSSGTAEGRGALVLARTADDETAAEARSELELIAEWLRPAIEAHLGSALADAVGEAPRVSALFRVLNAAASTKNESILVRLYANALAIWHDVDLRAYVEDAEGNFRLAVALPGAPASGRPTILVGSQVSSSQDLTPLSSHDVELLGFHTTDHAMAARVNDAAHGMAWLLVLSGGAESVDDERLALYTDVLRQTLQNVAAASLLDAERTIWQRLVRAGDRLEDGAEAALQVVRSLLHAAESAMSMAVPHHGPVFRGGKDDLLADVTPSRWDRLTTTARFGDGATLALAVRGPVDHFFTSRDRHVIESVGQLLGTWAEGALRRAPASIDRRVAARTFEDMLEETATQAAARGTTTSVVVIRFRDGTFPVSLTHKLAAQLRVHVRAGESVGVLGADEIGLLLYDATPHVARTVVGRLRRAVAGSGPADPLAAALVGIAQCAPDTPPTTRLVRAAREDARAASTSPSTRDGLS